MNKQQKNITLTENKYNITIWIVVFLFIIIFSKLLAERSEQLYNSKFHMVYLAIVFDLFFMSKYSIENDLASYSTSILINGIN
jgi:uncharacterized membrane protein